jgi:hypothetical protein
LRNLGERQDFVTQTPNFCNRWSDDPNPESSPQAPLGIDRFHRSEEEYARSTGARFRSSSDAGELAQQGGSP